MHVGEDEAILAWLTDGHLRERILLALTQPLTAAQLARKIHCTQRECRRCLAALLNRRLVFCLNPLASSSRLYWVRPLGVECQVTLKRALQYSRPPSDFPSVDWKLYGGVCFRHRSACILALTRPLNPASLRKKAVFENPKLRMSANNARDIVRQFLAQGIVHPVPRKKRKYPDYELTAMGRDFRRLLAEAQSRSILREEWGRMKPAEEHIGD